MATDPFDIVFAEFLRAELAVVLHELDEHYVDGGRASGARDERLAAATAEAYRAALHAVSKLPVNNT